MSNDIKGLVEEFAKDSEDTLWKNAHRLGLHKNKETFNLLSMNVLAIQMIICEDDGVEHPNARDFTPEEIASVEKFTKDTGGIAYSFAMHDSGSSALREGNYQEAIRLFSIALQSSGFSLGHIAERSKMAISVSDLAMNYIKSANRSAAQVRHAKTHATKNEIRRYWTEQIDRTLSNAKAADMLLKEFPLEHRTLSTYVSEFKKELLAAR